MKKKAATPSNKRSAGYPQLVTAISAIDTQMVTRVATVANQALVLRNWMVGAYIVEFEQNGSDRAKYGERLLERLVEDLKAKGFTGLVDRPEYSEKEMESALLDRSPAKRQTIESPARARSR